MAREVELLSGMMGAVDAAERDLDLQNSIISKVEEQANTLDAMVADLLNDPSSKGSGGGGSGGGQKKQKKQKELPGHGSNSSAAVVAMARMDAAEAESAAMVSRCFMVRSSLEVCRASSRPPAEGAAGGGGGGEGGLATNILGWQPAL